MEVVDLNARLQALDSSASLIVQAPAGSGKTGLLTQRYLKLLSQAQTPEEIIAITFTKKAAAEMRSRILAALKQAESAVEPENEYDRLTWTLAKAALQQNTSLGWNLLSSPSRMRLMTIDALSAWLANQLPVISQFGALRQISEMPEALYRQAVHQTLQHLESNSHWSHAVERLISHLDNNLTTVEGLLMAMLAKREQWLRHIQGGASNPQIRHDLENALRTVVTEHIENLKVNLCDADLGAQLDLIRFAAANAESDSALSLWRDVYEWPEANCHSLELWLALTELFLTKDDAWRKQVNKGQGFPAPSTAKDMQLKSNYKAMKERMTELLAQLQYDEHLCASLGQLRYLPSDSYTENQWSLLEALFELLPLAVAELYLVFSEHGCVDFSEVSKSAIEALGAEGEPTDLALILDYRIQHIMIDEFQDTSFSQFQLLTRLTTGWQNADGRSLFLVGDPMQSIYRFREAEVGFFLWARRYGVGDLKLQSLNLSVNFRSQAGVVDWVNAVFSQAFPSQDDSLLGAVAYSSSVAFKAQTEEETVEVYPFYESDYEAEAAEVVRVIRTIKQQSSAQSVAVLVQARTHLVAIIEELKRYKISYQAIDVDALSDRGVIQDLSSLTRALLHAGDTIAWLALLRAPWCGLTLQELEWLASNFPQLTVWQSLNECAFLEKLADDSRLRVQRFINTLGKAVSMRGRCSLRDLVESTWLHLAGPACVTNKSELVDVDTFLQLLGSIEQQAEVPQWRALEEKISRLYAKPDVDADVNLQLMTIHKSKGLEFDHVLLPGLGRKRASDDKRLLMWMERPAEHQEEGLLLAPLSASGDDSCRIYDYLRRIDQAKLDNESTRLLYVAATRAKRKLYLFAHTTTVLKEEVVQLKAPPQGVMLAKLWPNLSGIFEKKVPPSFVDKEQSASSATALTSEYHSLLRLPAKWQFPLLVDAVNIAALEKDAARRGERVELAWSLPTARHVGTLVHLVLMQMAVQGVESWSLTRVVKLRGYFQQRLMQMGVAQAEIAGAMDKVVKALSNVLQDPRGQWILQNSWVDAHNEYAISGNVAGKSLRAIIDRTFIDDQGVRWIIDYKTAEYMGDDVDGFLASEQLRYAKQLELYARLLSQGMQQEIKLGLYFPLMSAWRAWSFVDA